MLQPNHLVAGRYRVVRHIANGGMGAVYEAEHIATEAHVALKLLLPQMLHVAAARRRFELEAKVSARVDSEHIVRVFDAGVDGETHSPYLAMELLAGETLAARIRERGPLSATRALEVLRQVARGLDAAHGYRTAGGTPQPIVHRDLKPENLFLARRADGTALVKIVDFGIAKVLSDATGVSREVRGTPLFMAYEQVAGEAVSPQTDIWSLGLLTYFMLTGRSYWPAMSKAAPSTEALFAQILTLPLPRPSQRLHEDGIPLAFPPTFDHWLLTCLQRQPARRYPSAGTAIAALERALQGEGAVTTRPLVGSPFNGRATTRYERPATPASASVTSVPPVASEGRRDRARQREPQRGAGRKLGGALAVTALVALAGTWSLQHLARREPAAAGSAASRAPAGSAAERAATERAAAERPEALPPGVRPLPRGSTAAPSAPGHAEDASSDAPGGAAVASSHATASHATASHPASASARSASASAASTPAASAPRASSATSPTAPRPSTAPAVAPVDVPRPLPAPAPSTAGAPAPREADARPPEGPARVAPSEGASSAANGADAADGPHGEPTPGATPCGYFDPYTGRCANGPRASESATAP